MAALTDFWSQLLGRDRPQAPGPSAPALPAGTAGFYILRTCATGPLSELHEARVAGTGEHVALKVVPLRDNELNRERFLQEAAAAGRLQHPGIVRTLGAGIVGQGADRCGWLAMEWVNGTDLSHHTRSGQLLPPDQVLRIGAAAAEALAYAHGRGVVHRDLKPSNLLYDAGAGLLKIGDFGCARLLDSQRSRSGLLLGTPAYMAPEQLSGVPVDGRCDLYALGLTLFELLTGHRPFERPSMGETLAAIAAEPAPALSRWRPGLPPVLDDILARLLAKSPLHRHADGFTLAHELRLISPACARVTENVTLGPSEPLRADKNDINELSSPEP